MRTHVKAWYVALSLAFAAHLPAYAATNASSAPERLKGAAELTSLDYPGIKPWHMKLEVTLFDKEGKNPQPATIEVWSAKDSRKVVESLAGTTVTDLNIGGKLLRTSSDDPVFFELDSLLDHVLEPISPEVLSATGATEQNTKLGSLKLECILPQLVPPATAALTSQPLSLCMDAGTDSLRLTIAPGHVALVRVKMGSFLSKQVPVELQLLSENILRDDVKIIQLATFEPAAADFTATPDLQPVSVPLNENPVPSATNRVGDTGDHLWSGNPIYPLEARHRHITGTVKFHAVIGVDGRIASLSPEGDPSPILQGSASDAVKPWIFRPLRIAGVPVPFETEITTNFNMNP